MEVEHAHRPGGGPAVFRHRRRRTRRSTTTGTRMSTCRSAWRFRASCAVRAGGLREPAATWCCTRSSDSAVLTSPAYLARLNNPTRWTQELMKSYRGDEPRPLPRRLDLAAAASARRPSLFASARPRARKPRSAPGSPAPRCRACRRGPASPARALLQSAAAAPETREQGIRGGRDAGVDWAVVVTGHDAAALAALAKEDLSGEEFVRNGAERAPLAAGCYSLAYAISREPPR